LIFEFHAQLFHHQAIKVVFVVAKLTAQQLSLTFFGECVFQELKNFIFQLLNSLQLFLNNILISEDNSLEFIGVQFELDVMGGGKWVFFGIFLERVTGEFAELMRVRNGDGGLLLAHVLLAVGVVIDAFAENSVFFFKFDKLVFVRVDFSILGSNNILKLFHFNFIMLNLILHLLDGQNVQLILAIILSSQVVDFMLLLSHIILQVLVFLTVLLLA
jgi:hypothetical protein